MRAGARTRMLNNCRRYLYNGNLEDAENGSGERHTSTSNHCVKFVVVGESNFIKRGNDRAFVGHVTTDANDLVVFSLCAGDVL